MAVLENTRGRQYKRLRQHVNCVVFPKVAMFVLPARALSEYCYTNKVVVLEERTGSELAICRSSMFVEWVTETSTSFGVGGGISLSLTKGVNTIRGRLPGSSVVANALGSLGSDIR